MDAVVVGVLVGAALIVACVVLLGPETVSPLSELLGRLEQIDAAAEGTAATKRSTSRAVYESFRRNKVSIVGRMADVFPGGSAIVETPLSRAPYIGFDFTRIKDAQLRSFTKGRSVSVRASLDTWEKFQDSASILDVLKDARVFCDRQWYPVENLYLASSPSVDSTKHDGGTS